MSEIEKPSDVAALAVQLLSAYLANNSVPSEDLAGLIRSTKAALTQDAPATVEPASSSYTPAVSVRKSLASPDHIISLIDGKAYKVLKRHLATHGLTPDSYRERYNLPASYPMVAPTFAAHRRAIAEKIGLGSRKPVAAPPAVVAAPAVEAPVEGKAAPKKRATKAVATKPKAETAASVAAPATAKARKPRGKLGLFGNADTKAEPAPKASVKGEATSAPVSPKPAKQKRMARTPKAAPVTPEQAK